MIKNVLIVVLSLLFLECAIPYDGETRYIFATEIVDKNNNPLTNIDVNVYFSNESSQYYGPANGDLIVQSKTDRNGFISLVFPYSIRIDNCHVVFGNENQLNGYYYQIINIKKSDFTDFKLQEPTIQLLNNNEIVELAVRVMNNTFSKFVSKVTIIGQNRVRTKNYNPEPTNNMNFPVDFELFYPVKNQEILLQYEIVETINGQTITSIQEESITILENGLTYEINL